MFFYNIKEYVKVYPDFIPRESCKILIDKLEQEQWEEHTYSTLDTSKLVQYGKEFHVTSPKFSEMAQLKDGIWWMLKKYTSEHIGWADSWYNGWQGFSPVRFNKYTEGTAMQPHCDHITTLFDGERKGIPVFTVLGMLNDDFEGGDFLMWEDEKIELPAGSLIIFPSNFMYPHSVTPVTKGYRYSYVSWVW